MTNFYKKPAVSLDISEFMRSVDRAQRKHVPKAVVDGIADLARQGDEDVTAMTKMKFRLHSDWIPSKIKSIPITPSQREAAVRSLNRYHDFVAAVYLRPNAIAKNDASFMADHEYGKDRRPHKGNQSIAVPMQDLKNKSYRTGRGRVRKRWKPETLLKQMNKIGSKLDGMTTTNQGKKLGPQTNKVPSHAFLIKSGSDVFIVRRTKRNAGGGANSRQGLEFLYVFKKRADIRKVWSFEPTVIWTVERDYKKFIRKAFRRMPAKL